MKLSNKAQTEMSSVIMLLANASDSQIVNEEVVPIKKGLVATGAIKPKRGHKLFMSLDGVMTEVVREDFEEDETLRLAVDNIEGMPDRKRIRKLKTQPGARYYSALNLRNAIRKAHKEEVAQ